ncbi:MAG: hypothetical protein Q8R11_03265, partial [bacterium]|nr:hypothetical protein [bacterium]
MQKETRREVGRVAIKTLFLSFFPGLMGCTTSRKETGELRPNITTDELLKPEDRENAVSNRGWTVVDPSLPPDVQLARSQQENRIQPDFYSVRIDGTDTGIGFGRKAAQTSDKIQRTTLVAFTLLQENGIPIWRFFKDNPGK